ncbi:NADPh:adrenodoxin mitochondrial-like protein, partial [Chrysochromulina tobinii]
RPAAPAYKAYGAPSRTKTRYDGSYEDADEGNAPVWTRGGTAAASPATAAVSPTPSYSPSFAHDEEGIRVTMPKAGSATVPVLLGSPLRNSMSPRVSSLAPIREFDALDHDSARRCANYTDRDGSGHAGPTGPAGFYTADQLLKSDPGVHVDIYERLPVPYGLVRYGVAPDHQAVKNVTDRFEQIVSDPRCSLLANVRVGAAGPPGDVAAHLPFEALREQYHAVVLAYGADADRSLGLSGEGLRGVHSARTFVEWYNGHPHAADRDFELGRCETAVIIGHGNVALDCARMLSSTPEQLVGDTDVAAHAAAALSQSAIRQVVLLGRRGVLHAAFTIKELRELSKRAGATFSLLAPADAFNEAVLKQAATDRPRKRLIELMSSIPNEAELPNPPPPPGADSPRAVRVQFQRAPLGFVGAAEDPGRLGAVRVGLTKLEGEPSAQQRAHLVEGSAYDFPCGLVLKSVGYRSSPLEGAPFDEVRGVVPNRGGRVTGAPGLYVAGWLKRGPTGVILTNVNDANETAATLIADRLTGKLDVGGAGADAVRKRLAAQRQPVLDFEAWKRIDASEVARGKQVGKVREKLVDVSEMLRVAMGQAMG